MDPSADVRAPGAAVTMELCGSWDHQPPCPVAAHFIGSDRVGPGVSLRILFATEPDRESEVRQRIAVALANGQLTDGDGAITRWRVISSAASPVAADEHDHAERLTRS